MTALGTRAFEAAVPDRFADILTKAQAVAVLVQLMAAYDAATGGDPAP